jgi:predicted permease
VRSALGAGRGRLLRQLLTEALLLGVAGAAIGLAIAYAMTRVLMVAQPADLPRLENVGVNSTVVWFTVLVSIGTSLIFGAVPALQSSGAGLPAALRDSTRGGAGAGTHRLRSALVVVEMALAVVLLVGAGLLLRSFVRLTEVDPGFRPERVLAFRVTLQGEAYRDDAATRARIAGMLDRLRALPGASSVGATNVLPFSGRGSMVGFEVEGAPPPPPNVNPEIALAVVTPEYFQTIGAPLALGRHFTDRDHPNAPRVAIANRAAVSRWFPGQDPLGRRVNTNGVSREIVGVVSDIVQSNAAEPAIPSLFVPLSQRATRSIKVVIRTTGDSAAVAAAILPAVRAVDPDLAVADLGPLADLEIQSRARPRFYTGLLLLFAGVALALAATGIFGVMSYTVAQRSREISIRMALGAPRAGVLRMIVRRAVILAVLGAGCGLVLAAVLTRVLQGQLFGVTRLDPLTFGAVILVLVGCAAVAAFLPARRAATLDPATALREG